MKFAYTLVFLLVQVSLLSQNIDKIYDGAVSDYYSFRYNQAISGLEQANTYYQQQGNVKSIVKTQYFLCMSHFELGNTSEALGYLFDGSDLAIAQYGEESPEAASFYIGYGKYYHLKESYDTAKMFYKAALDLIEEQREPIQYGEIYANLGYTCDYYPQFDSAVLFYQKAAAIMEATLGTYHPYTDWIYASIPYVASQSGNYQAEVEAAEKSLQIKIKLWGQGSEEHLNALVAMAIACEHSGDVLRQKEYFELSLPLTASLFGMGSPEYATRLTQLGNAYSALQRLDEAVSYNQQAYELRKKLLGDKHEETLSLLRNIGNVYFDAGRYRDALVYYQQNLDRQIKIHGKKSQKLIQPYEDLAQVHENTGNWTQAEVFYLLAKTLKEEGAQEKLASSYISLARIASVKSQHEEALNLLDEALLANLKHNQGSRSTESFIKNNIGAVYQSTGQYKRALEYLEESLNVRVELFGEHSKEAAQTMSGMANAYFSLGKYKSSETLYTRIIKIKELEYGPDHPQVASSLVNLANVKSGMGAHQQAFDDLRRAEVIHLNANGENSPALVSVYHNLAITCSTLARFEEAMNYSAKHKTLSSAPYGARSEQMASHLNTQGMIRHDMGYTNEAFELYRQAMAIYERAHPQGSLDLAAVYNNMGIAFLDYQEYAQAGDYLQEALRLYKEYLGSDHVDILTTQMNLGLVAYGRSNYQKAIEIFQNTLFMGQNSGVLDSLNQATVYQNLGVAQSAANQKMPALESFRKSLTIREASLGTNNVLVADMLINIGNILMDAGQLLEAGVRFEEAESIYLDLGNAASPVSLTKLYLSLSHLSAQKPDLKMAMAYADKAILANRELNEEIANRVLYFIAQVQKVDYCYLEYLATKNPSYLQQSSELLTLANDELGLAEDEILSEEDRVEFGVWKSLLTNVGIKNAMARYHLTGQPELLQEALYYAERSKANVLVNSLNESRVKAFAGIDQSLVNREKELKITIQRLDEEVFKLTGNALGAARREALQQQLFGLKREYEASIARLRSNPRYRQLSGDMDIISLEEIRNELLSDGEAIVEFAASDSVLHTFLVTKDHFQVFTKSYEERFDQMITAMRNAIVFKSRGAFEYISGELYRLTLLDVEQYLDSVGVDISTLTIVPEGPLNYFPFESLWRDGKYLIEDYDVQYSYSLTLSKLLRQGGDSPNQSLLAFAPVFSDPSINTLTKGAKEVFVASRAVATDEMRGFSANGEFINSLPGTKSEVEAIDLMMGVEGYVSEILVYEEAKEEVIKSGILKDYKYIHFATHGFVNEANPEFSGIFMSQNAASTEDCILFTSEIYNLEMNADLVTLSACETGLGKFASGEGIVGLTRAFLYAGAKNLLVSQWKVSDESTARLMVDFYKNVLSGKDKASALREAKLALIKDPVFDQPYYWAPFVLVGE